MEPEEAVEFVQTPQSLSSGEQELSINFVKTEEKASVYTTIASQTKRLLTHSDVSVDFISVYDEEEKQWKRKTLDEYEGNEIIFGLGGKVPLESLKIKSNPRGNRSFAAVISTQESVDIDTE